MTFKSEKIAFFFEFLQIKMVLISGLRRDRGNEVCNFEGSFIRFKQDRKFLIFLL